MIQFAMNCGQRKARRKSIPLVLIALLALLTLTSCSPQPPSESQVTPIDQPSLPQRGFFMGILPTPSSGQSSADAYNQASSLAEFVPVWGRPTPFYELAQELGGSWGDAFVEQYIRRNGMFPIINLSFIGTNMQLVTPPDIS